MKKVVTTIVVIAGTISLASSVFAGPMCQGGKMRGAGAERALQRVLNDDSLAKELGVTEDQVATLSNYVYEHRQNMIKLQSDRQLAQVEIDHLLKQDNPDVEAVMKAVDHAGAIETDIRKAQVEQTMKVKTVLGKDTLAKMHEYFEKKLEERMQNQNDCGRGGPCSRGHRDGFGSRGNMELQQQPQPMQDERQFGEERANGNQPSWMDDEMLPPPSPEELFSFKS